MRRLSERPLLSSLLLACAALLAAPALGQQNGSFAYGVFFDAGSSGTRLSVYRWPKRTFSDAQLPPGITPPVEQIHIDTNATTPGVDQPSGRSQLSSMLSFASSYIASQDASVPMSSVPLFLAATAGLRILDAGTRTAAMAQIRAMFAASGFLFKPEWARVISGEEEGTYGWLAVNTAFSGAISVAGNSINPSGTVGALDLGGASTQMTFMPPAGVDMLSGAFRVALSANVSANVYSHSFLYMGMNQATRRMNEQVVAAAILAAGGNAAAVVGATLDNPCYFPGYVTPIFNSTLTSPGLYVTFNGTGNFSACVAVAAQLMVKSAYCLTDPITASTAVTAVTAPVQLLPITTNASVSGSTCSVNGEYMPPVSPPPGLTGANVTFAAFSSFSYLYDFLGLPGNSTLSTLAAVSAASCATPWANVSAANAGNSFASGMCLSSGYVYALLAIGYGLPTDSVYVVVYPASARVSYAPGAMLYYVNSLPYLFTSTSGSSVASPFAITVGLSTALGIVAFLLVALCVWMVLAVRAASAKAARTTPPGTPSGAQPIPDWKPSAGAQRNPLNAAGERIPA